MAFVAIQIRYPDGRNSWTTQKTADPGVRSGSRSAAVPDACLSIFLCRVKVIHQNLTLFYQVIEKYA